MARFQVALGHSPKEGFSDVGWMVHVRHKDAGDRSIPQLVVSEDITESVQFGTNTRKPGKNGKNLRSDRMFVKWSRGLSHQPFHYREKGGGFHAGRKG